MANQVTVSNDHSINVTIEPPANVQVQVSRAVIGTVANVPTANFANYAGNVTVSAQPNITSLGTLTNLTSNGNITAPFFIGNVVGNISGNITVPGTNTAVLFNQLGNAGASDALKFDYASNVLTANGNIIANYFIGNGSQLTGIITPQSNNANYANFANFAGNAFSVSGSNVTGAVSFATTANAVAGANVSGAVAYAAVANSVSGSNVSGAVAFATTANSVTLANVSGAGNIASINITGNLSQILYGNGVFAAAPNVSNVANANYANFAGEAFSVSASNIVGTVNLANFATTANAVAGANVSGAVANATYANTSGNATTAGTVTTNAQPNITSVGTLTGLTVSGNILPNANITYDLGNNTNRFKDLYLAGNSIILGAQTISANATGISFTGNLTGDASGLANITGANVTGQVGNALVASTVYTNAQPNITSVGNLTSLTVSGDAGIAGNLTVGGNISYVNVNNLVVQDPVIELGGGPNGAPLTTNDGKDRGTLLHYYTTTPVDAFMGWDNGNGEFAFGSNVTNNLDVMTFNTLGNVRAQTFIGNLTGLASSATVAASANAVAGANVSGQVNYAQVANSVAVGNVSGIGNVATLNLDGNLSNILYGNGVFAQVPNVSNVANANFANFAGNAFSVSGSNVTGQVANALVSGTVYTNAQPNITSVGTLTSLAVTGNITSFANIAGDYFLGNGALLTGVGDFSAALGYHGSFFSNVTQTIASTTTAYPITLNNTSPGTYGIAVTSNSRITMTYAGTYNIQYSVQFTNTDNAIHDASIWLRKNGVDVPDTNSVYAVTARRSGINGQLIGAINYIVDANANDYYELIWQAESTSVSLEYIAPGTTPTSPATPSAIVTAMQVTNVQAATLSGNLTGNLIGNTYGLSGTSFVNIIGNISGNVFTGNGSGLTQLTGANVTGAVAFATTANSVALSNVSGAGNIASINLDGNVSNLLTGSGTFVAIPTVSSNANYANFAGEAFSVNASNIVGTVNLANFATTANAVAGANVSGAVAFATTANSVAGANVSGAVGLASFATVANSVSGSNVTSQVANALIAGTVYTNAQPNITSVGTLSSLAISGNVTSNNANLGNLVTANFFSGNGSLLTGVIAAGGANISNGNSNVSISTAGGNVTVGVNGTANVIVISNIETNVSGALNASGQITTPVFLGNRLSVNQSTLTANVPGILAIGTWNNSAVTFDGVVVNYTDTASNANSNLLRLRTTSVDKFTVNKSGNVNFAGIITGDAGGLSNVSAANITGTITATTAGTVTTNAQPNITSLGTLTSTLQLSNGFFLSDPSSLPGRFIVNQGGGVGTGITANYYNHITQTWNNSSVQFTTLVVGATDVTSDANSLLFNATTNAVSKFSINKSGNVVFAGVMTGDGGGLSNIAGISSSNISNGTSNVSIPVSNGNVNISVGGTSNVAVITGTGVNIAGTLNATGNANVSNLGTGRVIATGNISGTQLISNIAIGTAPFVVTSTTQVANLNVASAGLATFATTANAVAGANVSGAVAFATTANSVALGNVSGAGNIASINLDGSSSNVLYGNGVFAAGGGGGGTPGGSNTQLQFNNAGSFGGISTVTWNGSNISLGNVANVKVTGGVNNEVIRTDGTGNLSFSSIAQTLLVGTRAGPYTVPITNYTFQVTTRSSGNVTVYVN